MCENCDEAVAKAREEILALMNGEQIESTSEDPQGWTEASRMALVISRAAVIIQNTDSGMKGAPLSIIIGSVAGIAMEAEMVSAGLNEILGMMGHPENLN